MRQKSFTSTSKKRKRSKAKYKLRLIACVALIGVAVFTTVTSVNKIMLKVNAMEAKGKEQFTATASTEADYSAPVEEAKPLLFNVDLSEDVQLHIIHLCEERHIDPAVIIAMIERESGFQTDVVGDNGQSFGLMQIQPRWHYQRMLDLGCTDLLDPIQNVTVGIDLLAELLENRGIEWALTAYNSGTAYANEVGCNNYAAAVMARVGEFEYVCS